MIIQPFPSGRSGGGHSIIDANDTAMTARDKLKFGGDLETSDNSTDEQTEVVPHELTSAEMAEIMATLPMRPRPTTVASNYTPVGTVISVMGNEAPLHYLACNGQVVNILDYPELANYFMLQFGSKNHFGGDGTATFAVPDLRGEFLRGTGTNGQFAGSGEDVGVHQIPTYIPQMSTDSAETISGFHTTGATTTVYEPDALSPQTVSKSSYVKTISYNVNPPVAISYSTRPTNTSVLYCIATKDIYANPVNNYSTSEKVVGTWIDGKPIYQKTIVDTLPSATTAGTNVSKTVAIGASIELGWIVFGIRHTTVNGVIQQFPSFSVEHSASNNIVTQLMINTNSASSDKNSLRIFNDNPPWNGSPVYVTLQYTKTTD